jgi:hypothetical protein
VSYPLTEVAGQLHLAGSCTLDASGNGVITFDPANARQRWEVESVVVSTNQAANATVVPVATVAKNTAIATQLSQGNSRGASWSGNQDIFTGKVDISPADFLSVIFQLPPGQGAAGGGDTFTDLFGDVFGVPGQLAGVIAFATVTGTKYTRRA